MRRDQEEWVGVEALMRTADANSDEDAGGSEMPPLVMAANSDAGSDAVTEDAGDAGGSASPPWTPESALRRTAEALHSLLSMFQASEEATAAAVTVGGATAAATAPCKWACAYVTRQGGRLVRDSGWYLSKGRALAEKHSNFRMNMRRWHRDLSPRVFIIRRYTPY